MDYSLLLTIEEFAYTFQVKGTNIYEALPPKAICIHRQKNFDTDTWHEAARSEVLKHNREGQFIFKKRFFVQSQSKNEEVNRIELYTVVTDDQGKEKEDQ